MDAENLTAGQHECEAIRELEKYDIEISTEHNGTWGLWQDHDLWVPITNCPFCGLRLDNLDDPEMTCGTCHFWTEGKGEGDGTCPDGFGGCWNIEKISRVSHIRKEQWKLYEADMMITEFDEMWGFWAGKDFGCIHHKRPKNEQNGVDSDALIAFEKRGLRCE